VFHIYERAHAPQRLCFGDDMQAERRFTRTFGAINFDHTPARDSAHAQRQINGQRTGRDHLDVEMSCITQPDDGTIAKPFGQVRERIFKGFLACLVYHDFSPASGIFRVFACPI
jgi:hypothetical protein